MDEIKGQFTPEDVRKMHYDEIVASISREYKDASKEQKEKMIVRLVMAGKEAGLDKAVFAEWETREHQEGENFNKYFIFLKEIVPRFTIMNKNNNEFTFTQNVISGKWDIYYAFKKEIDDEDEKQRQKESAKDSAGCIIKGLLSVGKALDLMKKEPK